MKGHLQSILDKKISKKDLEFLESIYKVLGSDKRLLILKYCKKPHNISSLRKKLGIKYKSAHGHVMLLKKYGFVETEEKIDEKGKNVFVTTSKDLKEEKMFKTKKKIN